MGVVQTQRNAGGEVSGAADQSNIDMDSHRVLCFQLKSLGKALKEIGLLIMQDAVWNRVTANREKRQQNISQRLFACPIYNSLLT